MPVDSYLIILIALVLSILISFFFTPLSIRFARKIGAVDVPLDDRRMHTHPVPLLGGISIILSFFFTSFVASLLLPRFFHIQVWQPLLQLLPGSLIIAVLGVFDDRKSLPALFKFVVQFAAAGITVAMGVQISTVSASVRLFGKYAFSLGYFSIPITLLWIVGVTNALNFIDGLDGLADGIASIASLTMLLIALLQSPMQLPMALLTAALSGGCLGLLPYNRNPAKVFMGDTGATFLGFVLAVISIQGLFKFYAAVSFAVPLLILGLPLFDTISAIVRRIWEGKSPFTADRNHIHHKLIDLGLSQKQSVFVLYAVSLLLGVIAVTFTVFGAVVGWRFTLVGIALIYVVFYAAVLVLRRHNAKAQQKAAAHKDDSDAVSDLPNPEPPATDAKNDGAKPS